MNEQLEFAKLIATRLDAAGVPYMLTGSMALAVYATPRMTRDVDLVIECTNEDVDTLVRSFEADCYVSRDAVSDAVERRSMFNVIHDEWVVKADFIVRKDSEYRATELSRRRRLKIEDAELSVVAPEDLVLSKLVWWRDSDSDGQRLDIVAILESVAELDQDYLESWARTLGVADLLAKVKPDA